MDCPDGYKKNTTGKMPPEAKGRRVRVILANGVHAKDSGGPMDPPGWPANGSNGCRWSLKGDEWDIAFYKVL